ncbi:putative RNA binding protein Pym [Plectosphaerella cucumerina]|uniref:RNA binding protein Pym n=1 Tax=Plectosphaerella cucumerina TaxID=40658 RepID=A0A8K0X1J3_9PEZI|nr:putative RNA binding protein Pym [Plectosphaerella cucumerina]
MPEKKKAAQPSNAGIITDNSGDRFIPESQRADGTTRKAIKIRPGFRPDEDIELYRSRGTEAKNRPRVIPGAAAAITETDTAASNKNAKRREARKKAKEAADGDDAEKPAVASSAAPATAAEETEEVDPEVEKAKKARALKKKLRQAKELQTKKEGGGSLLPEQIAKVIKINELIRELEALGFDADGEPKDKADDNTKG